MLSKMTLWKGGKNAKKKEEIIHVVVDEGGAGSSHYKGFICWVQFFKSGMDFTH